VLFDSRLHYLFVCRYWASIPIPHGCLGFRAACPFCATPLTGDPGWAKLIFQDHVDWQRQMNWRSLTADGATVQNYQSLPINGTLIALITLVLVFMRGYDEQFEWLPDARWTWIFEHLSLGMRRAFDWRIIDVLNCRVMSCALGAVMSCALGAVVLSASAWWQEYIFHTCN